VHILFLTDNFPPEVNAPASRTYEHCREWVKESVQVTVVTCAPNFPKGKVYSGYRNKIWQQEVVEGVRVIRVGTYITANEGLLKRTLDYMSFMVSSFVASLFVRKVDVVIGTSPQFFTVCAAYMVGLVKRVPWVFELRDIWPESIRAVGAVNSSRILNALERLEMFLYRKATVIISVTNSFRDTLIQRGVDGAKIHVVTNGVDTSRFIVRDKDPELVSRYQLSGKFVAGYIGTHGMAHALDTLLDAAVILKNSTDDQFRLILLGDGANKESLFQRAKLEGLDNVIFVNSVSKDEVVHYWSLLDVSIIHLKKTDLFKTVIPSKLFECMGMGIPVLHGVQGESAEIVTRNNVGLLFDPENAVSLVEGLKRLVADDDLYDHLRTNGPIAAKRYDRALLAADMVGVIRGVVKNEGGSA